MPDLIRDSELKETKSADALAEYEKLFGKDAKERQGKREATNS